MVNFEKNNVHLTIWHSFIVFLNRLKDNDFPINQILQRPPDEARLFFEAQHNKNLDIKYLEQKLIWHANREENFEREILNFKFREEKFKEEIGSMEGELENLRKENDIFKLEMRKIIHERALSQLAITGTDTN